MAQGGAAVLGENAGAGNGSAVAWPGGQGVFMATATFGGGTVKLQTQMRDTNGTWVDVDGASLSAAGTKVFYLGPCPIRMVATTATAVYAYAAVVKDI